jgi:hypothetical protein
MITITMRLLEELEARRKRLTMTEEEREEEREKHRRPAKQVPNVWYGDTLNWKRI